MRSAGPSRGGPPAPAVLLTAAISGLMLVPRSARAIDAAFAPRPPAEPATGAVLVSLDDALRAARTAGPELAVARAAESVAHAEVGVAGVYPNPTVSAATSTQTARASATVSIPLVILGQRGAAVDAARADEATVHWDTLVAWNDVRQSTAHAFSALWLAEGTAGARRDAAAIQARLESAVVARVEVGAAPQIDALRVHAERLRADADLLEATAQVTSAAAELGRWMGRADGEVLRASGDPLPAATGASLAALLARIEQNVRVQRERADVLAAGVHVERERALVRPSMTLDLGLDALDPTIDNVTNY
ncbi:MAG: TolC family protein, partial [Myxococcales bacterium]|nr:TolC family protein [Myxococcales bacterium]